MFRLSTIRQYYSTLPLPVAPLKRLIDRNSHKNKIDQELTKPDPVLVLIRSCACVYSAPVSNVYRTVTANPKSQLPIINPLTPVRATWHL